uniref:PolC-type DNA polymerase III n=1 Tax=Faecalibaculum rodentium TaxID=1702221 RepID=UPI0026F00CEF
DQLKTFQQSLMDAAKACGKPVLATGDAHYVHPHDKRIRDIYINSKAIGNSRHPLYKYNAQERRLLSNPDQHLRTTEEMLEDFDWLPAAQAEEIVITNPEKLRREIETIYPVKDRLYPPDIEGSDQKLRDICFDTAHKVYGPDLPEIVEKRLDRELDSIIGAGYYVVYYISHLLVKKSNEDGYLVGSRGSVGSSFVATMSNITEVNPLTPHYICKNCQYCEWISDDKVKSGFDLPDKECPHCGAVMRGDGQDIPFETFLGFNGDKVPDIDLNFSGEYQAKAHAYTKEVFGEDHVFRAGTVGTVQEKTAYGYVKGYEEEMGLEATPYNEAKRTDLAKGCEGVKRTTGQHPGGIVVVPLDMDVHDFTPVQYPANNPDAEWKTTHFDFHQIHDNILKFDILGHVDPTAMKLFERMTGMDVTTIPMNDPETMAIFSGIDSLNIDSSRYDQKTGAAGIPEFGTPFVRGILELTKPTTFAELVSISGLSHGTDVWLNNAKDLIDNGTCVLSEVIGCRDDIMIDLMNYGLPPKDSFTIMESVRKGKGLKPEWEKLMKDNSVPDWFIDSCKKIKYMFPKAHAVAYVMNAVRIAWFKVHMPVYYYCQFFSIRCDAYDIGVMMQGEGAIRERMNGIRAMRDNKTEKPSDKELAIYDTLELALEMVLRGYRFSRISMERSDATEFIPDPEDEKAIIPPFTSVDGLGANVGKSVVAARTERPFLSKEDVLRRTQLSRTLLDKLDSLGACQDLDEENQMTLF